MERPGETCARCGHTAPDCTRCGQSWEFLGAFIGSRPYCHTFTREGPTCYEVASRTFIDAWPEKYDPRRRGQS